MCISQESHFLDQTHFKPRVLANTHYGHLLKAQDFALYSTPQIVVLVITLLRFSSLAITSLQTAEEKRL